MNSQENQNFSYKKLSDCIKILSAEAVEAAKSGHPGMPMGFSDVMSVLAFEFLKFNPHDPKWFNRDRLVLSAGHGSMLLYSFFYLSGYKGFSLDNIKNFRKIGSPAAGHPENFMYEGIETTTGPLGQGIANAVGMAIAGKKHQAKLGKDICDHKVYTIVGDGCLMEGISYEAASLAGHLCLNNLIVLFDDNNISIDGSTSLSISENQRKKFEALGFETISADGHDYDDIRGALKKAQNSSKPAFVAFKTRIGKGADTKEGSEKSHGAPLGESEIEYLRKSLSFEAAGFDIPNELKVAWEGAWKKSADEYKKWQDKYAKLDKDAKAYLEAPKVSLDDDYAVAEKPEATRVSSGRIVADLMKISDKVICGSADLAGSNGLKNEHCRAISAADFSGNFIYYGVREHAMAAIMNGLALSGFLPIGGTFFVFSDYMRPAIRLSALMGLPVIYVMTHDSIGVGEDGPTHQPIEHLASLRAMPGINVFRPADFTETRECYEYILKHNDKPAILALSRQNLPQIRSVSEGNQSKNGAYIISDANDPSKIDVTIFASGSEVEIAMQVQKILSARTSQVRVCSIPSFELLADKGGRYLKELQGGARLLVGIEAGSGFGWERIIGNSGLFFGMDRFGASAPASDLYKKFGLEAEKIADKIADLI